MNGPQLRLILDNVRSAGNVGAILRTADACGVELVYVCGTTPHPRTAQDNRPEHVIVSNQRAIAKTSLGAETTVRVRYYPHTTEAINEAKALGFKIIVVEQSETSLKLNHFLPPSQNVALVVGNEVSGVASDIQTLADAVIELPMMGQKESLNVAIATSVVLYYVRFPPQS